MNQPQNILEAIEAAHHADQVRAKIRLGDRLAVMAHTDQLGTQDAIEALMQGAIMLALCARDESTTVQQCLDDVSQFLLVAKAELMEELYVSYQVIEQLHATGKAGPKVQQPQNMLRQSFIGSCSAQLGTDPAKIDKQQLADAEARLTNEVETLAKAIEEAEANTQH